MKAVIRQRSIMSPYSGAAKAVRLIAAIPNMAGHCFGKPDISFRAPYFILESSDNPDDRMRESFFAELSRQGFDELEQV